MKSPYTIRVLAGRLFVNGREVPAHLDLDGGTYDVAGRAVQADPMAAMMRAYRDGYRAGCESRWRDCRLRLPYLGEVS